MRSEDIVVAAILEKVEPCLEQLINKAGSHYTHIIDNKKRIEVLEKQALELAAIINDYQALQAQVKTLQFEVARLEYIAEGRSEPIPWQ